MQRSLSSSAADHLNCYRSSPTTRRHLPVHLTYNNTNDYDASDTDSQHRTGLQRTLSTSSVSSTSSLGASAAYRILPVRYSSVDRNLQKVPVATVDERGINVRIHLDRPPRAPHHHHRRRRRHHHTEEHHRAHMMKDSQHYGSCPVLDKSHRAPPIILRPSNITYIETRSIVRGCSNDQLSKTGRLDGQSRSRDLSLDTNSLPRTRVIDERRIETDFSHAQSSTVRNVHFISVSLIRRASRTISSPKQVASKIFAIRFVRNTSPPFITNSARRSINRRITRRISSPRRRSIRTSSIRTLPPSHDLALLLLL